jgi:hypothetical protein
MSIGEASAKNLAMPAGQIEPTARFRSFGATEMILNITCNGHLSRAIDFVEIAYGSIYRPDKENCA